MSGGRLGLACALLIAVACADAVPVRDPDPGVSRSLAEGRARQISDLSYDLHLTIPESREAPIEGEVLVRFDRRGGGPLVLDFAATPDQVRAVDANGDVIELDPVNEHLVIPRDAVQEGENAIRVSFRAGDGSLNRNDEFLYALFVPDRARWAFPVFDQPDLKARFRLTLDVPGEWTAVANGAEAEVVSATRPGEGERLVYRFAETEPIPTYLFAFAAGRFRIEEAERDGRRMRLFHRETDREKVDRNLDAIFDLHATALGWLETYTGIPYPFGKFDFVAVPSFQYGGMEHPGAIFYRASSLFLDESATQGQLLGRASVIAHETAHMWFGDLVTMRWFDDVWMKEVFANFMAAKIVNPSFPELDHDLRFLLAHYPAAYGVDRTDGANPIRQPLENLNEAGTLYGAIIYQKAPIVMRQLELLIGEETFRNGLREYLEAHRFGNATWPDLIEILDRRSPLDLEAWSRAWVTEPGRPTIRSRVRAAGTGEGARLELTQEDPRGRDLLWAQPLSPWVDGEGVVGEVRLEGPTASLDLTSPPQVLLPNGDGVGYGRFELTDGSRAGLLAGLADVEPPLARAVAWLTLWDDLLERGTTPQRWLEMARTAVARESNELLVDRMTDDLVEAYWSFLGPAERAAAGPELEALLRDRLEAAEAVSLKATFFAAYRDVAASPEALERLERAWRSEQGPAGLPLSERDLTTLAQALALRGVEGSEAILDRQAARIENPDRLAEFAFVRPSLSPDPAVRNDFFRSLADPSMREREPWVLEALSNLNHPLRAESALENLRPTLDLLEEIQRTGDIFFPQRWLDAALGGHASPEAAGIIRTFLREHPDYPFRLRLKLLQSADRVFRAASLRDPELDGGPAVGMEDGD